MPNKPNTLEVRSPSVSVTGEKTDSVELVWTLPMSSFMDGAPAAKYSAHPAGSNKVVSPNTSDLIKKLADAQNAMFQPAQIKNVSVKDGSGQSLDFTGYDGGPSHSVMFGGVSNGKTIIHRCSKLFFINTSIYSLPATEYALLPDEIKSVKSPTEMMKSVLEKCIDKFSDVLDADTSLTDKAKSIKTRIHNKNKKIIETEWFPILEASTDSGIEKFAEVVNQIYSVRQKVFDSIYQAYVNSNTDFSTVISQFCSMFQMVFVPSTDGKSPGKFISFKKMLQDAEDKDIVISNLSMSPGSSRFLTVAAVAMQSAPGNNYWGLMSNGSGIISWPEEVPEEGELVTMQAPSWIPSDELPEEVPNTGTNLDFNANADLIESAAAKIKDSSDLILSLIKDLCRLAYNNAALGTATAAVSTVLDVSWEIGKRYAVKQAGGDVLFSGFLRGITHRVNSSPDRPEAVTQLSFSHVETNGFTLPNK